MCVWCPAWKHYIGVFLSPIFVFFFNSTFLLIFVQWHWINVYAVFTWIGNVVIFIFSLWHLRIFLLFFLCGCLCIFLSFFLCSWLRINCFESAPPRWHLLGWLCQVLRDTRDERHKTHKRFSSITCVPRHKNAHRQKWDLRKCSMFHRTWHNYKYFIKCSDEFI